MIKLGKNAIKFNKLAEGEFKQIATKKDVVRYALKLILDAKKQEKQEIEHITELAAYIERNNDLRELSTILSEQSPKEFPEGKAMLATSILIATFTIDHLNNEGWIKWKKPIKF